MGNRREFARRRKIREYWAAHPERRKAQSETQKQVWTPDRRKTKSAEMKQFFDDPDHPERRKAKSKEMTRVMRSRKRRRINSENMKRLKANAEFEARRIAAVAKAKADPEKKARRQATLAETMAAPGVRKRAIRNSKKTTSSDEYRARMSADGKKRWAELLAGSGGAKKRRERGRQEGRSKETENRLRRIAALEKLGRPLRSNSALVYPDAPATAETNTYALASKHREVINSLKEMLTPSEAEALLREPVETA